MNKPTNEQIKEFWEWSEVKPHRLLRNLIFLGIKSIDLNNLFKHAMPKVKEVLNYPKEVHGFPGEKYKFHRFLTRWIYAIAIQGRNPELALFWAIWAVKEG